MDKTLNDYISLYKARLQNGDIQIAYERLLKYVMTVKGYFEKTLSNKYSCGNVSPGYMDFTYFPFFDIFLKSKKLRFGIVLNHKEIRFELWLMGQNAKIQEEYWNLLKNTKWNKNQPSMPKYSVLEIILVNKPDFDKSDELTVEIVKKADLYSDEIISYIKKQGE